MGTRGCGPFLVSRLVAALMPSAGHRCRIEDVRSKPTDVCVDFDFYLELIVGVDFDLFLELVRRREPSERIEPLVKRMCGCRSLLADDFSVAHARLRLSSVFRLARSVNFFSFRDARFFRTR